MSVDKLLKFKSLLMVLSVLASFCWLSIIIPSRHAALRYGLQIILISLSSEKVYEFPITSTATFF